MATEQSPLGKRLLKNIFKLLLLCLLLGVLGGYLFIDIPMVKEADGTEPLDTTYLSMAIGFVYGAAFSFLASGVLIIRHFIQARQRD